jgi:hypothetical protein
MAKQAKITIDWLRKGLQVDDSEILKRLVSEHMPWLKHGLDEQLFEQTYGLAPLPDESIAPRHFDGIGLGLVNSEITEWNPQIEPSGEMFIDQVKSVLPKSVDDENKRSISYALGRILIDDIPQGLLTEIPVKGLDFVSSSLLSLHRIARTVEQSVPWLLIIWQMNIVDFKLKKLREAKILVRNSLDLDDTIDLLDAMKDDVQRVVASDDDPLIRKFSRWRSKLYAFNDATESEIEELSRRLRTARNDRDEAELKRLREERNERRVENEKALRNELLDLLKKLDEEIQLHREKLSVIERNQLSVRSDALTDTSASLLSQSIRENLNILKFETIVDISKTIANTDTLASPSTEDIQHGLKVEHWKAKDLLKRVRNLFTERFITSFRILDLKLRYILTPGIKKRVTSPGLLETVVMERSTFHTDTIGFEPRGADVHLEPVVSNGPSNLEVESDQFHIDVNEELVSFRYDLFDQQQGWRIEPWQESLVSAKRDLSSLTKDTKSDSPTIMPTARDVDILGPLMGLESRTRERLWILKSLGIPQRTISESTKRLMKHRVVKPIHHPLIDYCGLPESIMIFTADVEKEKLKSFVKWLTGVFPYVKVRHDYEKGNVVAEARTPLFGLTRVEEHLNKQAQSLEGEVAIGRLKAVPHTYYFTVLQRLYHHKDGQWIDPWYD